MKVLAWIVGALLLIWSRQIVERIRFKIQRIRERRFNDGAGYDAP